ncbi:MAG: Caffeine dehydrogenase subunit gamma [Pseudomonadales bacterium]|nr:Caffeine dehydrogenase subunit gamma [Pseudomonadales bacterium]
MAQLHRVRLTVNGREYEREVEPRMTLVDFLRHELGLTGTHVGCEHGVCGACTIIKNGQAVRACLMLAVQADGAELRTVEGLAGADGLHPVQQAFIEKHGLQCGFCTPGFLMSTVELLEGTTSPGEEQIREAIGGNICRCTGYQSILESVELAAQKMRAGQGS